MDRFQQLSVFLAVVEDLGFSSAARRLGMSPAAVTRTVAALEARIGAQLLIRSTRSIRLTDAGNRYYEEGRKLIADVEMADQAALGVDAPLLGHLAISSPVQFGDAVLTPILLDYLETYELVTLRALYTDRFPNLHEDGIDVALWMGALQDPTMTAIGVGSIRRVLCAAPAYLQAHGAPANVQSLTDHRIILSSADSVDGEWRFDDVGSGQCIRVQSQFKVSSNLAAIDAARAGWGITRVMSYQVAEDFAAGLLQPVLVEVGSGELPVHVVHHQDHAGTPKVRSLVDFLVARLRRQLALDQTSVAGVSA